VASSISNLPIAWLPRASAGFEKTRRRLGRALLRHSVKHPELKGRDGHDDATQTNVVQNLALEFPLTLNAIMRWRWLNSQEIDAKCPFSCSWSRVRLYPAIRGQAFGFHSSE